MTFHKYLNNYRTVEKIDISDLKNVRDINKNFDKIIVSVHKSDKSPFDNYKLSPKEISIINTLKKYNNVVLVVFSNPYTLLDINLNGFDSVMLAYQNSPIFQKKLLKRSLAQMILMVFYLLVLVKNTKKGHQLS